MKGTSSVPGKPSFSFSFLIFSAYSGLINQRSAVVNKDVLTQINCLIAMRINTKLDKQAVKTWVESVVHPDDPRINREISKAKSRRDIQLNNSTVQLSN